MFNRSVFLKNKLKMKKSITVQYIKYRLIIAVIKVADTSLRMKKNV